MDFGRMLYVSSEVGLKLCMLYPFCKPAECPYIQPDYTKEDCVTEAETGSEAHQRTGL